MGSQAGAKDLECPVHGSQHARTGLDFCEPWTRVRFQVHPNSEDWTVGLVLGSSKSAKELD